VFIIVLILAGDR